MQTAIINTIYKVHETIHSAAIEINRTWVVPILWEHQHRRKILLKRLFDILISSVMLILCAPLMILIALLIKMDSDGPIFYAQTRVGLNRRQCNRRRRVTCRCQDRRQIEIHGTPFKIYKFRSMSVNAESKGAVWCRVNDSRATRVGAILRKTHLDELPQLINILSGEMSIVGPRPERPEFVSKLVNQIAGYERRLIVKPGLTGLAQIYHRADQDLSDVRKKVKYDIAYLKSFSVLSDIKIILGTVPLAAGFSTDCVKDLSRIARRNVSAKSFALSMWVFLILIWVNNVLAK